MNQTQLESLLEVSVNVAIGFTVSVLIGEFIIIPFYAPEWSHSQNIQVTLIYTIISLLRGYLIRRFFNAQLHKQVKEAVKWILAGSTKD